MGGPTRCQHSSQLTLYNSINHWRNLLFSFGCVLMCFFGNAPAMKLDFFWHLSFIWPFCLFGLCVCVLSMISLFDLFGMQSTELSNSTLIVCIAEFRWRILKENLVFRFAQLAQKTKRAHRHIRTQENESKMLANCEEHLQRIVLFSFRVSSSSPYSRCK